MWKRWERVGEVSIPEEKRLGGVWTEGQNQGCYNLRLLYTGIYWHILVSSVRRNFVSAACPGNSSSASPLCSRRFFSSLSNPCCSLQWLQLTSTHPGEKHATLFSTTPSSQLKAAVRSLLTSTFSLNSSSCVLFSLSHRVFQLPDRIVALPCLVWQHLSVVVGGRFAQSVREWKGKRMN